MLSERYCVGPRIRTAPGSACGLESARRFCSWRCARSMVLAARPARHWHDQMRGRGGVLARLACVLEYQQISGVVFLFLLMTLGLATIALLPLVENANGWLAQKLEVFGRVPLFYYVLHIPLIHLRGRCSVVDSNGHSGSVAARESSDEPGTVTGRIYVELAATLSGMGNRNRHSVFPVSLVCGTESTQQESLALVSVTAV